MYKKVLESTDYIMSRANVEADIAIILGSGLGGLVNDISIDCEIPFSDIPNFPASTVKGHSGKLIYGQLEGKKVLVLAGRFHYYEGYTMREVSYPIYVFKQLEISKMIVTNACGGINKSYKPGDIMIIDDFINLMGSNPLVGKNDERLGNRFPDMTEPFSNKLINLTEEVAKKLEYNLKKGVYAGFMGPYYETRAEIKMIAGFGADVVGMSTVPEVIAANHTGIETLGLSCVTNMATGIQKKKHSHDDVIKIANETSVRLVKLVKEVIRKI